jgi:hypothetical protein
MSHSIHDDLTDKLDKPRRSNVDRCQCINLGDSCKGIHEGGCRNTQSPHRVIKVEDVPKKYAGSGALLLNICEECWKRANDGRVQN